MGFSQVKNIQVYDGTTDIVLKVENCGADTLYLPTKDVNFSKKYTFSVYARTVSGTMSVQVKVCNVTTFTMDLTTSWQRFHITTSENANGRFIEFIPSSNDAFYMYKSMLQEGTILSEWIPDIEDVYYNFRNENDTTIIHGGNIATSTITADQIKARSITTDLLRTDAIQSINYSPNGNGSFLNLADGTFDSKNFKWDTQGNVRGNNAYFENATLDGTIYAKAGRIGGTTDGIGNYSGGFVIDSTSISSTLGTSRAELFAPHSGDPSTQSFLKVTANGTVNVDILYDGTAKFKKAEIEGSIEAKSGHIGGFVIDETSIHSENNNIKLTSDGKAELKDATVSGSITATEGNIGGFTISSNTLTSANSKITLHGDTGEADFTNIKVGGGTIGGFTIGQTSISNGSSLVLNSTGASTIGGFNISATQINSTGNAIVLKSSGEATMTNLTANGIKATGADITGKITATSGTIGGVKIEDGVLQISSAISSTLSEVRPTYTAENYFVYSDFNSFSSVTDSSYKDFIIKGTYTNGSGFLLNTVNMRKGSAHRISMNFKIKSGTLKKFGITLPSNFTLSKIYYDGEEAAISSNTITINGDTGHNDTTVEHTISFVVTPSSSATLNAITFKPNNGSSSSVGLEIYNVMISLGSGSAGYVESQYNSVSDVAVNYLKPFSTDDWTRNNTTRLTIADNILTTNNASSGDNISQATSLLTNSTKYILSVKAYATTDGATLKCAVGNNTSFCTFTLGTTAHEYTWIFTTSSTNPTIYYHVTGSAKLYDAKLCKYTESTLNTFEPSTIYTTGTTTIDGGKITTGSITAEQISTDAIKSRNYDGTTTLGTDGYIINNPPTQGSFLDLANGEFKSANLSWNEKGQITCTGGTIGGFTIDETNLYIERLKSEAAFSPATRSFIGIRLRDGTNNDLVYRGYLHAPKSNTATNDTNDGNDDLFPFYISYSARVKATEYVVAGPTKVYYDYNSTTGKYTTTNVSSSTSNDYRNPGIKFRYVTSNTNYAKAYTSRIHESASGQLTITANNGLITSKNILAGSNIVATSYVGTGGKTSGTDGAQGTLITDNGNMHMTGNGSSGETINFYWNSTGQASTITAYIKESAKNKLTLSASAGIELSTGTNTGKVTVNGTVLNKHTVTKTSYTNKTVSGGTNGGATGFEDQALTSPGTGWTAVAALSFSIGNTGTNGVNSSRCTVYGYSIDSSNNKLTFNVRNDATSDAKVDITVYVLWEKSL